MPKLIHPLLMLIAQSTEKELVLYIEYLKAENRILRSKLPKRVAVTLAERARLVKLGTRVGSAIKELITIVTPRTFARWASGEGKPRPRRPRKPGRPRTPEAIRELVVQMPNPDERWMAQQARNLRMFFDEQPEKARYVVCDRDTKFTEQFREILKDDGVEVVQPAVRAPNQNVYAERWAQSLCQECLDHFIILGERHLWYLVQEYVRYYHAARPHQSLGNLPPDMKELPEDVGILGPDDIECHEWLGGLLKHYERKAA